MNEHHSARRVGFAAVAAVALLAVGAWAYRQWGGSRAPKPNHLADAPLGDPSKNDDVGLPPPEQQPAPQPEEARELVAKSYQAALHSPHRLEWEPEEVVPSNKVFDLCDDEQAKEAGLFLDAANDARDSLSVDCDTSQNRFAYRAPHEALRFANSPEEAQALLTEFAEHRTIKGERFRKPVGMLLGHRGPRADPRCCWD